MRQPSLPLPLPLPSARLRSLPFWSELPGGGGGKGRGRGAAYRQQLLNQIQKLSNQLTRDAPDIVPLEAIVVHGHKRAIG